MGSVTLMVLLLALFLLAFTVISITVEPKAITLCMIFPNTSRHFHMLTLTGVIKKRELQKYNDVADALGLTSLTYSLIFVGVPVSHEKGRHDKHEKSLQGDTWSIFMAHTPRLL